MPKLKAPDLSTVLVIGVALAAVVPFATILADLAMGGVKHVTWNFLTLNPSRSGRGGGILPIIVSTLLILGVTLVAVVPFGLATAVLLSELSRKTNGLGRAIGLSLDVLAGVPSIVFGLFGSAFFCVYLGLGFSIYAGGLTLACMALPLFVRAAQEGISSVPQAWRAGAFALGMSEPAVLLKIELPCAGRAIALGLVLATGRALAETAALVFTSGYVDRMPQSLSDSGRALSVHIFDLSMNVAGADHNVYASVLVLIVLIGAINTASYWLTEKLLRRGVFES